VTPRVWPPVQEPRGNGALAERLEAFAALLELGRASPYAARAYRRAAEMIRATPVDVTELVRSGRARELRGIGAGIEARLRELVETGRIAELEELEREVDPELVGLGRFLGLDARRSVQIGRTLGIRTAAELREAARAGRLREVPGIGELTERKLLAALESDERPRPRRGMLLHRARALAEGIAEALDGVAAGDVRRWRDSCEHFAVVVAAEEPAPMLERFAALPQIVAIVERVEQGALGVTSDGIAVELVAAKPARFGTELVRATGAAAYVEALEPLPEAADEEGVYARLGIPYCPPELREAPFRGRAPELLELREIRGDLHVHTTWSDGKASLHDMSVAARELGYEYLAICDHTPAVGAVAGLHADGLRRQAEEVAQANERLAPFRVLRGSECDILPDGGLDLPGDVLADLEWVQLSLHAGQRAETKEITRRVVEAMRHPAVRCLSHPKGRIINHRPENALDLEEVFAVALESDVALEVNGLPDRLDLRGELVREAIDAGASIVCSSDAHSERGLGNMELAVATARRGWATRVDIVNTRPLAELLGRRA
jgi:DNA polymerase (family X)